MADFTGGRVFLQVVPSFAGVQNTIGARARRWGDEAGKAYKEAFNREANKVNGGAPGGPGGGSGAGGGSATAAAREGSTNGGAYAEAFRRKLQEASRNLPPARVGADFSAADRQLALLRNKIQALSGKTIGIDVTAEEAIAQARRIEAEIQTTLRDKVLTIETRSDLTRTLAQIKAVREEAEKPAHMRVDVDMNEGAFVVRAREAVKKAQAALPRLELDADSTPAQVEIARIRSSMQTLQDKKIGVDITAEQFNAEAARLTERLEVLTRDRTVDIRLRTDAAAAAAALAAANKEVDRLNGRTARVRVDSNDLNTFTGRLLLMGTAIGAIAPALVPIGGAAIVALGGLGAAAGAVIPTLGALVLGLKGVGTAVSAMADAQKAEAEDSAKAAQTARQAAASRVSAARQIESAEASLANTIESARAAEARANDAVTEATARVQKARDEAASAGVDAAERVADALKAQQKAEDDAARTTADNAKKVTQARKDLADAEAAQARATATATRSMADARQREADASKTAARDIQAALHRQADAEDDLTAAQATQREAQEDLTRARKDAAEQLEDLANAVAGGALDQRDAILSVADAQDDLNKVRNDPTANDRQRERAQVAYEQAVQRLKELELRNARLVEQQKEAAAAGVEGSDQVRAAQERIADALDRRQKAEQALRDAGTGVEDARTQALKNQLDALQAVADADEEAARQQADAADRVTEARDRLQDATDNAARSDADAAAAAIEAAQKLTAAYADQEQARIDGLARVADAQKAEADAVQARAEQQRQAAFSIEQAERSLESARQAAASAATANADATSSAQKKLKESMDDLGPAGQRFATFLFSLRGDVSRLQEAAAGGMLPGFEEAIRRILPLMPVFEQLLSTFGTALGDLAISAADALKTDEWQGFFSFLNENGAEMMKTFGALAGNILGLFPALAAAFGPIGQEVGDVLVDLTGRFKDFLQNASGNESFQAFLDYVRDTAPDVAQFIGSLADAFVNIVRSMAPLGPVILGILGGIFDFIAAMPPDLLSGIALAVIGIVAAFNVLGPVVRFVAGVIALMAGPEGLGLLGAVVTALGGPVTVIIAALVVLGAAFIALYHHSETFREAVGGALEYLSNLIAPLMEAFQHFGEAMSQVFDDIMYAAQAWWGFFGENIVQFAQDAWAAVEDIFTGAVDILAGVFNLISSILIGDWQGMWDAIVQIATGIWYVIAGVVEAAGAILQLAFDVIVKTVVALWNSFWTDLKNASSDAWNWITDKVGQAWGWIKDKFSGGASAVGKFFSDWWEDQKRVWQFAWDFVTGLAGLAWGWIKEKFVSGIILVTNVVTGYFEDFKRGWQIIWDVVSGLVVAGYHTLEQKFWDGVGWLRGIWDNFWGGVSGLSRKMLDDLATLVVEKMHGLEERFGWGVDWIKTQWDRIKEVAKAPIRFLIDTVFNQGLVPAFNWIAEKVGWDKRIEPFKLPDGFARGGILPGSSSWRDGDDQIIRARRGEGIAVSEAMAVPEAREALLTWNRLGVQGGSQAVRNYIRGGEGFARGGIVDLGRWFQGKGARVAEHPAFGGVSNVHKGRGHYEGRAIDVNKNDPKTGASESAFEKSFFDQFARKLRDAGWTVFWRDNRPQDHSNHLHAEAPTKSFLGDFPDGSFLGNIGDALSGAFSGVLDFLQGLSPVQYLQNKVSGLFSGLTQGGDFADLARATPKLLVSAAGDGLSDFISKLNPFDESENDAPQYSASGGVQRWRSTALQALSITGSPASWINSLLRRMQQESGGNPRAINNWDSNAAKGTPSKGLMQVIDPTFRSNALAPYNRDVYDPLSNIIASIRYANARYGSAPKGWDRKGGYATGGIVGDVLSMGKTLPPAAMSAILAGPKLYDEGGMLPPGYTLVNNATGKPEPVFNPAAMDSITSRANSRDRLEPLLRQLADLAAQGNGITADGLARVGDSIRDQARTERQLTRQGA